jgi:hypothetical protein
MTLRLALILGTILITATLVLTEFRSFSGCALDRVRRMQWKGRYNTKIGRNGRNARSD